MSARVVLSIVGALALTAMAPERTATACGPAFPTTLLTGRAEVLSELPDGRFVDDVARLVTPAHAYAVVIGPGQPPDDVGTRERALYERGDYAGVLALPAAKRQHRSTWAAYMLARTGSHAAGLRYYPQVRSLVDAGFADDGGLAASSLGQEARLHLADGDVVAALRLYAEQAALGHPDGATSLLLVARTARDPERLARMAADELGQRVLASYLYTRRDELTADERDALWAALAAHPRPATVERLAAAAYQDGRWDVAAFLVATAGDGPLASWVRAKLALRRGDVVAADHELASAAAGFAPACGDGCEVPGVADRVIGERALVAIAEGRFTDALEHYWSVRQAYGDDVNYVAERLVTTRELQQFVDDHELEGGTPELWTTDGPSMRALLGRRLMRDGDFRTAVDYLPDSMRTIAVAYGLALEAATATRDPITAAEQLYVASLLARSDGMELLGTSHSPDWARYGGEYDRDAVETWTDSDGTLHDAMVHPITGAEAARNAASAPMFARRYHYRYLASALAEQAADRLPHRSQAYAMTLCEAGRYVRFVDDARVTALWERYVRTGPSVDFGFGEYCPAPEFERARRFVATPRRSRLPTLAPVGGAAALVLALVVGALVWRRRQRRFAARP